MLEKLSAWRWCLSIILEQLGKTKTTVKKSPGRKAGESHLWSTALPLLFCFFSFAYLFIQPFNYLVYILSTYRLSGTDICIFLVTAGLSTHLQISWKIPRDPFPNPLKATLFPVLDLLPLRPQVVHQDSRNSWSWKALGFLFSAQPSACGFPDSFSPRGTLRGDKSRFKWGFSICGRSLLDLTEWGTGSDFGKPLRSELGYIPMSHWLISPQKKGRLKSLRCTEGTFGVGEAKEK